MAVRDRSSNVRPVYVYNTDVTDSVDFAKAYCGEYGIPTSQRVGLALGTAANIRPYDSEATIYALLEDIYDAVVSANATHVIVGAGCPTALGLLTNDYSVGGSNSGGHFDFVHLATAVKRIIALGYLPRVMNDGAGGYTPTTKGGAGNWYPFYVLFTTVILGRVEEVPTILELYNDPEYDAAIAAAGPGYGEDDANRFVRYKSSFNGDFSSSDVLPGGFAGYYSYEETTHPSDLYDKSVAILNRAIASEWRLSALGARKVFSTAYGLSGVQSDIGKTARASFATKKLGDAGLQVTYITDTGSDAAAEYLLPESGSHSDWTPDNLTDGTASPPAITADLMFGWQFQNVDPTIHWDDRITPTANGNFIGGRSGNGTWGKWCQVAGGHSAIIQQVTVGGTHANTANSLAYQADAVLALLAGKSLADAAFCSLSGTLTAIGDPLLRPFQ